MEILWKNEDYEAIEMRRKFRVIVNGKLFVVEVEEISGKEEKSVKSPNESTVIGKDVSIAESRDIKRENVPEGSIIAPMPGKITEIRVKIGDVVKEGDVLIVLEAMKMENEIISPKNGTVRDIKVDAGDTVNRGDVLLILD